MKFVTQFRTFSFIIITKPKKSYQKLCNHTKLLQKILKVVRINDLKHSLQVELFLNNLPFEKGLFISYFFNSIFYDIFNSS